jgi:hypothetical protein
MLRLRALLAALAGAAVCVHALPVLAVPPHRCSTPPSPLPETTMNATSAPDIQAVIRPDRSPPDADVTILLTITQRGPERLIAPHPLLSTDALVFHLRLPSGEERTVRSPPAKPGTRPRQVNVVLRPHVPQQFGIAVTSLLTPLAAGNYCFVIDYAWAQGEVWRSAQLSLTVE